MTSAQTGLIRSAHTAPIATPPASAAALCPSPPHRYARMGADDSPGAASCNAWPSNAPRGGLW
eukprot:gene52069-56893_t